MTQVYIIAGIIIAIIVLICFVFIRQTITKRHKEKLRLHRALDKRAKDLVQMLNAFPPNFLPQDLLVFLYRCIVDTYEQLSKLSPDEPEYLEHFKAHTAHMEAAMRAPKTKSEVSLQSSTQINEIRQYLNYLGRFMQKWMQRGNLSSKQYANYKDLLKKLITQLMIDNYVLSAKQAVQMEKTKLAVHYYMLAKNLLTKEGLLASKKNRLAVIDEELSRLEKQLQQEEETAPTVNEAAVEDDSSDENKQWQKYDEDADWKKKNVYD
ncbi:MAG: hypothetical protein ACRBCI_00155 [Cellvibrionaceae bacterium]